MKAADRLKILIDPYGTISTKSYDKETGAIQPGKNLREDYSTDAAMIGLEGWINELDSCNQQFESLTKERYLESSVRTGLRMKTVCEEIDPIYQSIIARINALLIIEGEEVHQGFAHELNQRIEHYKNLIAQRKGRPREKRRRGE